MRKAIAISILTLFFLFSGLSVSAQSPSPTRTPKGRAISQEAQINKIERQASQEARFCELRKSKIKLYFERMTTRLGALIERLQKLIDRIESRIDKIEAGGDGTNLTSPKADLESAKTKLADAKTKLNSLKTDIETFLTCEDPKGSFKVVRGKVDEIKKDLNEVHKLLVHIIGNIKGLRVGETERSPKPTETP